MAEVAFEIAPEWMVIAGDEGATHEIFGVLVTSGPVTLERAGLPEATVGPGNVLWVEYIAIAPSLRPDCPSSDRRTFVLKGIGPTLMKAAIERSVALGCSGRLGLHAEGDKAVDVYEGKWKMLRLGTAEHPTGGRFPVFFGSEEWARDFSR